MPNNSDSIIVDTSCLILLSRINKISLLKLPGRELFTTPQVRNEYKTALPSWINVIKPQKEVVDEIISMNLDLGEASAIALAMDLKNSLLIIDDFKGRKVAAELNIRYSGSLGLILRAKQERILPSVKPVVKKIEKTNFRVDKSLLSTILQEAGE